LERLRDRLERRRGRRRVGDHDRGEARQRGMPNKKGCVFGTPAIDKDL
jgi:hypothetical protein